MRIRNITFTTRYVMLVGILLLVANTALGLIILNESKDAMKTLINKNMLDVVKSAAGTLDGDTLGALTEEDAGGPEFRRISEQLSVFTDSVDIHFIYAVRQIGPEHFVFTVDPDPVDPAEFGEDVLLTDALRSAGAGIAAADSKPAADRWGNFYSAYCPVFDSKGEIAGIVGIDFDAKWYEEQIRQYTFSIIIFTILSVAIGSFLVFLITHRVSRKFRELSTEISSLSSGIDLLMSELSTYSGFDISQTDRDRSRGSDDAYPDAPDKGGSGDEMNILANKIHEMKNDLGIYLDYLRTQAYTDMLTTAGNKTAYHERMTEIDDSISSGTAEFDVIVFDLNNLKFLNDNLGHECGDYYIRAAGKAILDVFGTSDTYRIGGDEFAVISENPGPGETERRIAAIRESIRGFDANENNPYGKELSMAIGSASFRPGSDTSFSDVFTRADAEMYVDKKRCHSNCCNS